MTHTVEGTDAHVTVKISKNKTSRIEPAREPLARNLRAILTILHLALELKIMTIDFRCNQQIIAIGEAEVMRGSFILGEPRPTATCFSRC